MTADGYRIVWHLPGHRDEIHPLTGDGGSDTTYPTQSMAEDAAARRADIEARNADGGLDYYVAAYHKGVR